MRLATAEAPDGAIWVIGNAPTALAELIAHPPPDPALIVGLPVGFVGAAEAKAALARLGAARPSPTGASAAARPSPSPPSTRSSTSTHDA